MDKFSFQKNIKFSYDKLIKSKLINKYLNDINKYKTSPNNIDFFNIILEWSDIFQNEEYDQFNYWISDYEIDDPITVHIKKNYNEEQYLKLLNQFSKNNYDNIKNENQSISNNFENENQSVINSDISSDITSDNSSSNDLLNYNSSSETDSD